MMQFLIWFAGVFLCGIGITTVLFGICLHKEAIREVIFEISWKDFFIFTFIALFVDLVGSSLFYLGYRVMEHNI